MIIRWGFGEWPLASAFGTEPHVRIRAASSGRATAWLLRLLIDVVISVFLNHNIKLFSFNALVLPRDGIAVCAGRHCHAVSLAGTHPMRGDSHAACLGAAFADADGPRYSDIAWLGTTRIWACFPGLPATAGYATHATLRPRSFAPVLPAVSRRARPFA